mgnify:CR=1 FL=1
MLTILVDNVYSRLVSDDVAPIHAVAKALAVPVPGAKYTKWFRSGRWDGCHRFLERPSNRCYTGLLPMVRRALEGAGYRGWNEVDNRACPPAIPGMAYRGPMLRPYQAQIEKDMRTGGRGIVKAATGSGKTIIAAAAIGDLQRPTLFLVHRKELATQARDRFREWLTVPIGLIAEGEWSIEAPVVVAMIQSLFAAWKDRPKEVERYLATVGVVIADEAHRASSNSWEKMLRRIPAFYRFGLSGTPLVRNDVRDLTLIGLTGELLADATPRQLIGEGWLARPQCTFLDAGIVRTEKTDRLSYPTAYEQLIVSNRARTMAALAIVQSSKHTEHQSLLIVRQLRHGEELHDLSGIPFVHGQMETEQRKEIYTTFRNGSLRRLIASTIYDEGVDFPNLDVVVNLAGGKTLVQLFQRLGRAMHRDDPSQPVFYYDFMDVGQRHLKAHYLKRKRELIGAELEVVDRND